MYLVPDLDLLKIRHTIRQNTSRYTGYIDEMLYPDACDALLRLVALFGRPPCAGEGVFFALDGCLGCRLGGTCLRGTCLGSGLVRLLAVALALALVLALVEEAHEPAAKASSSKAGSSKAAPKAPKAKKTPPPAQGGRPKRHKSK